MRRLLLVLLMIATFVTPFARPAPADAAGQELFWDEDGTTFATFGANESVTIAFGTILFECDFFFPTADVYVMQGTPAIGDVLTDINGKQNTVFGASGGLFSDTIAVTKPSGTLGNGLYTVVYDECQDGRLDPVDAVFTNAFEVALPSTLPPIDPAIGALKLRADQLAFQMQTALNILDLYEAYQKLQEAIECIKSPAECVVSMIVDEITGAIIDEIRELLGLSVDPEDAARDAAVDTISHWKGIAADPPDPNFAQHTLIERSTPIDPETDDPLVVAEVALGNAHLNEAALAEALLHALERYQGAVIADDGDWALVHARDIQTFATLMAGQMINSSAAASNLVSALDASTLDVEGVASRLSTDRQRIVTSGFLSDEERLLLNLGMTQEDVDALRSRIAGATGTVSESELISALNDLTIAYAAAIPDLHTLAADMDAVIASVLIDPVTTGDFPVANASGPYDGIEGDAITLIGTASTSPSAIVAYDWDVDGDGAFDDASGAIVSQTFPSAFDGYVGLRVTNAAGLTSTSYAALSVGSANGAPTIPGFAPAAPVTTIVAGASQRFTIDASDADGDVVSVTWRVDGADRGTGAAFVYSPLTADIGVHLIEAIASDDASLGGEIRQTWAAIVRHPDADADGWDANVDCDDTNASVNLDAFEVAGNGRDDDCDPSTSDDPIDNDGDGFNQTVDCNDNDPSVNPGVTEIPGNGKNDDCNPATPDGDASLFRGYTLVEKMEVPVNGLMEFSTYHLVYGASYKLRVSGTFQNGDTGLGDAEYLFASDGTGITDSCGNTQIDDVGLQIDIMTDQSGSKLPDWGQSRDDHTYTVDYVGLGSPLFTIYVECDFSSGHSAFDNAGSLTLEIWEFDESVATTVVPFRATDYAYQIVPPGEGAGFEQPGFDDAAFSIGNAGFGTSAGGCENNNPTDVQTEWPVNTDILLRKHITLPAGTTRLKVTGTIDNDVTVYINGQPIGFVSSGFCIVDQINFIAPDSVLVPGDNVLAIRGHDFGGVSFLDVQVTALFPADIANQPPAVDAGPDVTSDLGQPVSLESTTFSDPDTGDSHVAAVDWGDGITTVGVVNAAAGEGTVAGTHSYAAAGSYTVIVTVTDDAGNTASDSFLVTVNDINRPPVMTSISDQSLSEGATLVVGVAAFDPDDDTVILSASGLPAFADFTNHGNGTGSLRIAPGFGDAGSTNGVTIVASDGNLTAEESVTITVVDVANRPPVADAGPDQTVNETETVTLDASGSSDIDGDSLSYSWQVIVSSGPAISLSSPTSANPSFTTTDDGVYVLRLTVSDGQGGSDTDDVTVTVGNLAPAIAAVGNGGPVAPGEDVSITVDASDPAGAADPLTVRYDCDGNGAFERDTGVCTYHQGGEYQVGVKVDDGDGGSSVQSTTVSVIEATSTPPTVTFDGNTSLILGETFAGTGTIADADSSSWTATVDFGEGAGREPLAINADNTFTVSHAFTAAGTFTIEICVTDGDNEVCASLTVEVTAPATERFAIFAGRDDCGDGNVSAIHWSGSKTSVNGDVHSNSGIKVSGSNNSVQGATTYRCDKHISGSKHTFTEGIAQITETRPWPVPLTIDDFTCDVSVDGKLDLSKDGNWWSGGTKSSRQLQPMTLCADVITLSGSNISGTVTLVADQIHISGSGLRLAAHQDGVLGFATGSDTTAIKISGSNSQFTGDLIARNGQIDLSGSHNSIAGSIAGLSVKLTGSSWTIGVQP